VSVRAEGRPVRLAICGWQASGKTALIEQLVRQLCARGMRVAVAKHADRPLRLDAKGTDSTRIFEAGADVLACDERQTFTRSHGGVSLPQALEKLGRGYDVILIEGHKSAPLPKIWLLREGEESPPPGLTELRACLKPGAERLDAALRILDAELKSRGRTAPRQQPG